MCGYGIRTTHRYNVDLLELVGGREFLPTAVPTKLVALVALVLGPGTIAIVLEIDRLKLPLACYLE